MGILLLGARESGWQQLPLGAGGQVSAIDIAPDGTMVARLDTYGAVEWVANAQAWGFPGGKGRWVQLVNKATYSAQALPYDDVNGAYEIRVAPSDPRRSYIYLSDGYIYRKDEQGASTLTRTNFPQHVAHGAAQNGKFLSYRMAVDPINADVVFAGTPYSGAFVTADAGTTWNAVPTVAAASDWYGDDGTTSSSNPDYKAGNLFVFDHTGPTSGGRTQTIYAASFGVGVYKSTDAGASWTLLNATGMPTTALKMQVDSNGKLWVCDGHLNKYDPGTDTWVKIADATLYSAGAWSVKWFAICPTNPNKIFCGDSTSWFYTSDGGSTFPKGRMSGASSRTATDVPYLKRITPFTVGSVVWHTDNVIYMADGTGVWYVTEANLTAAANYSQPPMTSKSAGIEQLVVNWIISPPGKGPIIACMDRPFFQKSALKAYPTDYGPNYNTPDIKQGFSLDYAADDPDFIIGLVGNGFSIYNNPFMVKSTDGGRTPTWTSITTPASIIASGGCLAALTRLNWVWAEANGGAGSSFGGHFMYTTDGGVTWADCTTPLGWNSGWYAFNAFMSLRRQMVIADRVNGCFYAYNSGASAPGFYRSADGGANWTLACAGKTDTNGPSAYNFQMRAVPAYSGYTGGRFFATSGKNDDDSTINNPFYSCQDSAGTITKTAVTGVKNVWSFGFGKPKPGGSGVPTIFIKGSVDAAQDVNGVGGYGIWRSDDFGTSWEQIADLFPMNSFDRVHVVCGDSNVYGRCYLGMGGSGVLMYDP